MHNYLDQETFLSLNAGDYILCQKYSLISRFLIKTPNCGGPGKHPTHFVKEIYKDGKEGDAIYIFHNGKNIYYEDHPKGTFYSPVLVGALDGAREILRS